jgi:hypothetical protein
MLVKIYAGEIAKTRVRANLIDPGIVRTRLRARACRRRRAWPTPFSPPRSPNAPATARWLWPPLFRCDRMNERGRIILATANPPAPSSARMPVSADAWSRDPLAVGFLRQLPEPVFDIRDEPLGGNEELRVMREVVAGLCPGLPIGLSD